MFTSTSSPSSSRSVLPSSSVSTFFDTNLAVQIVGFFYIDFRFLASSVKSVRSFCAHYLAVSCASWPCAYPLGRMFVENCHRGRKRQSASMGREIGAASATASWLKSLTPLVVSRWLRSEKMSGFAPREDFRVHRNYRNRKLNLWIGWTPCASKEMHNALRRHKRAKRFLPKFRTCKPICFVATLEIELVQQIPSSIILPAG